jgi:ribose transport system permease protein
MPCSHKPAQTPHHGVHSDKANHIPANGSELMRMAGNSAIRKRMIQPWQRVEARGAIMLVVLCVVLSVGSPYFLTWENLSNLLLHSIFVMVVAFGMTFVLAFGGIDLSVGSVLGLCGGITGWLMMHGINIWLAIMAGVSIGPIIGVLNAAIITRLEVADFLATFAMLNIARGMLLVSTIIHPIRDFSTPQFAFIAQGYILGVPAPVCIAAILFVFCYFLFNRTSFGRRVIAVGNNEEAARLSGVSIAGVRVRVYALSGMLAGISGIMLASRLTAVQPLMGESYELDAIAAAVIGGTGMSGGRGSLVGTLFGALILALVANGLDLLSVNQFYRMIVTGAFIVIAVAAERLTAPRRSLK